jgi:molybdate transport system ATP-binding protein
MVRLNIGGVPVLARITQKSQHLLGIKVGDPVFAEIKSVALL